MAAPSACSLGSLCALSGTLGELVAARVVQGLGGALLLPVGRLAVLRTFPRERFLQAMSFIAIPGLIGPLIGPTLGGWLVEVASWHWIFLINLPVGVLGAVAAYFYMRNNAPVAVARFDWSGYLCWPSAWWRCRWRWTACRAWAGHAGVLVLMVFGLASLAAYWLHALRVPSRCSRPGCSAWCRCAWAAGQSVRAPGQLVHAVPDPAAAAGQPGLFALQAGLMMLPVAVAGMLVKRITTPLITRLGYRRVLVATPCWWV
jgi:MFS family permease